MSNNKQDNNKVIPLLVLVEDLVVFQALKDSKISLDSRAVVVVNSTETFLMNLRNFLEAVNNKAVKEEDGSRLKEKILSSNVK